MAENILEAFVVKRGKILLPALNSGMPKDKNTFWRFSIDRSIVHRGILIEATDKTVEGYHLYETEIPVIFSHPNTWEETRPSMKPCIGVCSKQWEVSKSMNGGGKSRGNAQGAQEQGQGHGAKVLFELFHNDFPPQNVGGLPAWDSPPCLVVWDQ